jgi:hypothetical protein
MVCIHETRPRAAQKPPSVQQPCAARFKVIFRTMAKLRDTKYCGNVTFRRNYDGEVQR